MNQLFGLQHRGDRHLGMGACFHGNFFCYISDGLVIHASNASVS